ncbi:hypothetical protein OQA88_11597 [Cercophora sp. LCS_1]
MSSADEVLAAPGVIGTVWKVGAPTIKPSASALKNPYLPGSFSGVEGVFEPDNRLPVDPNDYAEGGKYRSIVKLIIRYEGMGPDDKRYAIGTGYLISPNTLITAGHCVFDISANSKKGLGRVSEMKVFIGYRGRDSVDGSNNAVQERHATFAATTLKWVKAADRRGDVGFVQLDSPFTGNLRPFPWKETPLTGTDVMLGVIGYPGDKDIGGEKGAEMYELLESTTYSLKTNPFNMLAYGISTYKGQSGSPVILRDRNGVNVIGTHCYGESSWNSASVIGDPFGVSYKTFIDALTTPNPVIPSITSLPISTLLSQTESDLLQDSTATEGFFDILKDIGRVVAPIAQTALPLISPLLGPLGAPVSAIGGIALGALNKAVSESALIDDKPTPISQPITLTPGTTERAILAESALQTVLRMERSPASEEILASMRKKYVATGFTKSHAETLGKQMVPLLSQAGLRLATTEGLVKQKTAWHPTPAPVGKPTESDLNTGDKNADDLVTAISTIPVKKLDGSTESFFSDIGGFLAKGLAVAKPVLLTSARAGLQKIDEILAKKENGTESGLVDNDAGVVSDEKAAALLAHRAVVAECALQAVVEADKKALTESVILGGADGAQQEGFFDGLLKTIQVIGPAVMKVAPAVLKTAVPLVVNAVAGTEAAIVTPQPVKPPVKRLENGLVNGSGKVRAFSVPGNEGPDDRLFVTPKEAGLGRKEVKVVGGGEKPKGPRNPDDNGTDIDWTEGDPTKPVA